MPPSSPTPAAILPTDRDGDQAADEQQEARVAERAQVGVHADLEEEHRDEEVADRRELAAHPLGRRGAAQRDAGSEGADDGCELRGVGEQRRTRA